MTLHLYHYSAYAITCAAPKYEILPKMYSIFRWFEKICRFDNDFGRKSFYICKTCAISYTYCYTQVHLVSKKNMVLVWQLLNVYHYKESCSYQLILLSLEIGANFSLMIKQMSQLQYTTLTTNWTKFVNMYVHGRKHIIIRDLQMPLSPSDLRWVFLRLSECPCYMWMI